MDCKKCDREKPTKGGCAEAGIKTVQAPLRQAQRPASTGSATVRLADMEIRGGALFPAGEKACGAARN